MAEIFIKIKIQKEKWIRKDSAKEAADLSRLVQLKQVKKRTLRNKRASCCRVWRWRRTKARRTQKDEYKWSSRRSSEEQRKRSRMSIKTKPRRRWRSRKSWSSSKSKQRSWKWSWMIHPSNRHQAIRRWRRSRSNWKPESLSCKKQVDRKNNHLNKPLRR